MGVDLTEGMVTFASRRLGEIGSPDGLILKCALPSRRPREVKLYANAKKGAVFTKTCGVFAGAAVKCVPRYAIEDEGRLKNSDIRCYFLTCLFTSARFREARSIEMIRDLVAFHARHKLLSIAHNQT